MVPQPASNCTKLHNSRGLQFESSKVRGNIYVLLLRGCPLWPKQAVVRDNPSSILMVCCWYGSNHGCSVDNVNLCVLDSSLCTAFWWWRTTLNHSRDPSMLLCRFVFEHEMIVEAKDEFLDRLAEIVRKEVGHLAQKRSTTDHIWIVWANTTAGSDHIVDDACALQMQAVLRQGANIHDFELRSSQYSISAEDTAKPISVPSSVHRQPVSITRTLHS